MIANFHLHPCKVNKIITTFAKNNNEMTVERDIAGFVIPFAAGILTVFLSNPSAAWLQTSGSWLPATVSYTVSVTSLCLLMHPAHLKWNGHLLMTVITIAAFGCGCMTGYTWRFISIGTPSGFSVIPDWISGLGLSMKSRIEALPFRNSDTNHLIAALITGDRTGMSPDVMRSFRDSGAAHILALSGLHLGIIYGILSYVLSAFGNSPAVKRARSVLTVLICGLYTAATGAGASITRAFLFILIGEAASLTGRYRSTSTVLMTALFIQLLFSPSSSRNVGFQLSYAAMAGIAFIFPRLKALWPAGRGGALRWIWNSAAMSISCQITTGPLAYLYFGTFPQYFLLTNLLALPLVGVIIPMSLLVLGLDAAGMCPMVLLRGVEGMVEGMKFILGVIGSM